MHFRSIWALQSDIVIGECLYPVSVSETPFKSYGFKLVFTPNNSNKLPLNGKFLNLDISTSCFHLYTTGLQFSLLRKGTDASHLNCCVNHFERHFLTRTMHFFQNLCKSYNLGTQRISPLFFKGRIIIWYNKTSLF